MQTSVRRSKLNLAAGLEVPDVEETLSSQQIMVIKDVSPHKWVGEQCGCIFASS